MTLFRRIIKAILFALLVLAWLWGGVALYYAGPGNVVQNSLLATLFVLTLPALFLLARSFLSAFLCCLVPFCLLLIWWQSLTPSGNKEWAPDVAQVSYGEIQGDRLIMHNVRNFRYKSEYDFDERWERREYDLRKLQGLDIFLSYWASEHIAHTIMSWDFGDGKHLAISIETRKDKYQQYSAIKGFFKQFELSYIAADERDIIRLRTNYRQERVYYYRLQVANETSRALLESYLEEMDSLMRSPKFYNALTRNCTTTIHLHSRAVSESANDIDWRLILSGHLDSLLYERKVIESHVPFDKLRKASRIDLRMQNYHEQGFSTRLRQLKALAGL